MIAFFQNGGFPMYFILAFGMAGLFSAARAARRPSREKLGLARELMQATLYSSLAGVAAALATVASSATEISVRLGLHLADVVLQGVAESMSPVIMGFTFLSLTAMFCGVAVRRSAESLT